MDLTVTRADLQEYAIRSIMGGDVTDVSMDRVNDGIEDALDMVANERRFSFMQDTYDIITTPDVAFSSSLSINHGAAAVSDSDSGIPDTVGAFFEFNSERHWYEMTARASAAAATIRQNYTNESATNLSAVSGKLLYPLNDLPDNFNKITGLRDTSNGDWLEELPYDVAWLSKLEQVGQSTPEAYGLIAERNNPNQWQLYLFPAPDTVKRYTMTYFRRVGWYDTAVPATSTWKGRATADTDYVDWPTKLMYVLKAAVLAAVALEIKPAAHMNFQSNFNMQVARACNMDRQSGKPMVLSMGSRRGLGTRYDFK